MLGAARCVDNIATAETIHDAREFAGHTFALLIIAVVVINRFADRLLPHIFVYHMSAHDGVLGDELAKLDKHREHSRNPFPIFKLALAGTMKLRGNLLLEFLLAGRANQHLAEREPTTLLEF